jgi:1-Cys peroxiredoxin 6
LLRLVLFPNIIGRDSVRTRTRAIPAFRDELHAMDCLIATLSVGPIKSQKDWLHDLVAHCENNVEIKFPIIADADRSISTAFGMINAGTSDGQDLPLTLRAVVIINPENKLMLPSTTPLVSDVIWTRLSTVSRPYSYPIITPANSRST